MIAFHETRDVAARTRRRDRPGSGPGEHARSGDRAHSGDRLHPFDRSDPRTGDEARPGLVAGTGASLLDRLVGEAERSAVDYFAANSRSFSFAARLFPPDARRSVTSIYAYCRTTDDIVDLCVRDGDQAEAFELIDRWEALSRSAYRGRSTGIGFLDEAMAEAAAAGVPFDLVAELIAGVRSDIGPVEIEDWEALRGYCYRVASVIGLWMTRLFGITDPAVLRRAESLGYALQLTNILRDVGEDLAVDRVYLPRQALASRGLARADLEAMAAGAPILPAYRALMDEMIAEAERAYAEAFEAMPSLPGFYGRPVAAAAEIYRGILSALRENGYDNFRRRAATGRIAKLFLALRGLARLKSAGLGLGRRAHAATNAALGESAGPASSRGRAPMGSREGSRAAGRTAVVIGSGFGGLAAAVRLQSEGYDTTIVEKRSQVGGRASQIVERGYTFDTGPSLITAPEIIDAVFAAAGRSRADFLDLIPLDPYYRIYFHDGSQLDYSGDPDRMKAQMRRFSPDDADRYDDFMRAIRPIHDAVIRDRLGAQPFDTLRSMAAFVPRALAMGAFRPVARFVGRFFKDPRLLFTFSFHPLFIGGNPFRAPSVYLCIPYLEREGGVWFTRCGMYSLVRAFADLFEDIGGRIRTGAGVDEILVEGGRAVGVRVGDERIDADVVVSNADVGFTYSRLIAPEYRRKWSDARIDRLDYSMSCVLLYIGARRQWPKLAHHTLILSKRYEALLDDIFEQKILPDDFSLYLHAPTRTDPTMAPEGCESLYVLIPVPNLRAGIDWSSQAEPFAERVIDFLEAWGLEGLRENIEVLRTMTPDDFHVDLSSYVGNAFGIEPKLTQTAWFRPHNASEDVKGLYFVGAGTHPGAGVPGVILSAEAALAAIRRDEGGEPRPAVAAVTAVTAAAGAACAPGGRPGRTRAAS